MEGDKLILSLLARVRTCAGENEEAFADDKTQVDSQTWTKLSSRGMETKSNVREQRTLLSSITVLRDSIHMGSMSPSRTIHLGPSWPPEVSSLMVEENKPTVKHTVG